MGRFDRKYSDAQRDAVTTAKIDHGTPAKKIRELAAAGELNDLPAFNMPISTINTYAYHERKRRRGQRIEGLAQGHIPDAIETLARRLIQVADRETQWLLKQPPAKLDTARLNRSAAALQRLQTLNDTIHPPLPPDERTNHGQPTRTNQPTGLTANLQRAARRTNNGTPNPPTITTTEPNNTPTDTDKTNHFMPDTHAEEDVSPTPEAPAARRELAVELDHEG